MTRRLELLAYLSAGLLLLVCWATGAWVFAVGLFGLPLVATGRQR